MGATEEREATAVEPDAPAAVPITLNQYRLWKQRKDVLAASAAAEKSRKRAEDIAAGRVRMNGRELYEREPWVFEDSQYE